MILPILIYLAVGAIYTGINMKKILEDCKRLDQDLNYDNSLIISFLFIIISIIYPQFIWISIKGFFNRKK